MSSHYLSPRMVNLPVSPVSSMTISITCLCCYTTFGMKWDDYSGCKPLLSSVIGGKFGSHEASDSPDLHQEGHLLHKLPYWNPGGGGGVVCFTPVTDIYIHITRNSVWYAMYWLIITSWNLTSLCIIVSF